MAKRLKNVGSIPNIQTAKGIKCSAFEDSKRQTIQIVKEFKDSGKKNEDWNGERIRTAMEIRDSDCKRIQTSKDEGIIP